MSTKIRLHGRGGQGVVLAANLISAAAFQHDDSLFTRSFGLFGVERRGSPVTSFAMVGAEDEISRSRIEDPDCVVVLDPKLPNHVDVTEGLRSEGSLVVNTPAGSDAAIDDLHRETTLATVDATRIAMKTLGREIPNTAMIGAFARTTDIFPLEPLETAIHDEFEERIAAQNTEAAKMGYETVSIAQTLPDVDSE